MNETVILLVGHLRLILNKIKMVVIPDQLAQTIQILFDLGKRPGFRTHGESVQ